MNTRKFLSVVAVSAALLIPGLSVADSYWHEAPGERGYNEYPNHLQKASSNNGTPAASAEQNASATEQVYRASGPEGAPRLLPHSYAIKDGKVIHTDKFDHASKRPSTKVDQIGQRSAREAIKGG